MKKLVTALVGALICAVIGAAYLWQQWRDVRAANASLEARVQTLENPRSAAAATLQTPGADSAASTVAAAVPVEEEAASGQAAAGTQSAGTRMMIAQLYPDLAHELGLAPDELDRFMDLLASQQSNGTIHDPKQLQADQAAMLGNKYAQWQDYQQTLPGRRQVNQLRGQLAAAGSALPEAQVQPLMTALNAEQKRMEQDERDKPRPHITSQQEATEYGVQQMTESNRRLLAAATPYLDQQQLDTYRQMLDRQLSLMRTTMERLSTRDQNNGASR